MSEKKASKLKTWFGGGKDGAKKKDTTQAKSSSTNAINMSRESSSRSSISSAKSGLQSIKSPTLSINSNNSLTAESKAIEVQKLKKDTPKSPLSSNLSTNSSLKQSPTPKNLTTSRSPGLTKVSSMEKLKGLISFGSGNKEGMRERRGSFRSIQSVGTEPSTPLQKSFTQPYPNNDKVNAKSPSIASYRSSMYLNDIQDNYNSKINELEKGYQHLKKHVSAMISFEKENLDEAAKIIQKSMKAYRIRKYYLLRKDYHNYSTTLSPPSLDEFIKYTNSIKPFKGNKKSEEYNDKIRLIQHIIRGFIIRKRFKLVMTYEFYATKIQAAWKGYRIRNTGPNCEIPLNKIIKALGTQALATRKLDEELNQVKELISKMSKSSLLHQPIKAAVIPTKAKALLTQRKSSFSTKENGVIPFPKLTQPITSMEENTIISFPKTPQSVNFENKKSETISKIPIATKSIPLRQKKTHQARSHSISNTNSEFQSKLPQPGTFGAKLSKELGTHSRVPVSEEEYNALMEEVNALRHVVKAQLQLKP